MNGTQGTDRLYELLPVVLRMRDASAGYPLRALLRVITEQVDVVQDDIARLYDNWFIETCDDWVVPYIADLVGYRSLQPRAASETCDYARGRILVPRRDVARTVRARRRKGTLAVLDELSRDVAGWPAHAVEGYRLLALDQAVNHVHLKRGQTADLRDVDALDRLRGPFAATARSVDVRRPDSRYLRGKTNIHDVDVYVYRMHVHSVTYSPAYCQESAGPHCFTFSILGDDEPIFARPCDDEPIRDELDAPGPIRPRCFDAHKDAFYGPGRSFEIFAERGETFAPVPLDKIVAADLTDWKYHPTDDLVLVDTRLGRMAFNEASPPDRVRVTYHSGSPWEIGGGEYDRPTPVYPSGKARYTVGTAEAAVPGVTADFSTIADALRRAFDDNRPYALVEFVGRNDAFTERVRIRLREGQTLHLRAADGTRPVIRLLDYEVNAADMLTVTGAPGARLVLDGLLVTGRGVRLVGPFASVVVSHSTIGPGWLSAADASSERRVGPAIEAVKIGGELRIERRIVGGIVAHQDDVTLEPLPIVICDSIVDAGSRLLARSDRRAANAIIGPERQIARATLSIVRSTVFGRIRVHAVGLAENSIFTSPVEVARRQIGCVRFCYVPAGSRTPRRYHCQPDLARSVVRDEWAQSGAFNPSDPAYLAALALAETRVQPVFNSTRYDDPGYAQLSAATADEIKTGADDQSEMGVFHDLFSPQREDNLNRRLAEFTPAGTDVGLFHAT